LPPKGKKRKGRERGKEASLFLWGKKSLKTQSFFTSQQQLKTMLKSKFRVKNQ